MLAQSCGVVTTVGILGPSFFSFSFFEEMDWELPPASKPVFNSDGNLDFNMGKTMTLAKGLSARHVYERAHNIFCRMTQTSKASRMISLPICSLYTALKYWGPL